MVCTYMYHAQRLMALRFTGKQEIWSTWAVGFYQVQNPPPLFTCLELPCLQHKQTNKHTSIQTNKQGGWLRFGDSLLLCFDSTDVIGFEKIAHLEHNINFFVSHTALKYSSWASYLHLRSNWWSHVKCQYSKPAYTGHLGASIFWPL